MSDIFSVFLVSTQVSEEGLNCIVPIQLTTLNGFTFSVLVAYGFFTYSTSEYFKHTTSPILVRFGDPRSFTNLKSASTFDVVPIPSIDSEPIRRSILVEYGCGFNVPAFLSILDLYKRFEISPPSEDLKLSTKKPHLNLSS